MAMSATNSARWRLDDEAHPDEPDADPVQAVDQHPGQEDHVEEQDHRRARAMSTNVSQASGPGSEERQDRQVQVQVEQRAEAGQPVEDEGAAAEPAAAGSNQPTMPRRRPGRAPRRGRLGPLVTGWSHQPGPSERRRGVADPRPTARPAQPHDRPGRVDARRAGLGALPGEVAAPGALLDVHEREHRAGVDARAAPRRPARRRRGRPARRSAGRCRPTGQADTQIPHSMQSSYRSSRSMPSAGIALGDERRRPGRAAGRPRRTRS